MVHTVIKNEKHVNQAELIRTVLMRQIAPRQQSFGYGQQCVKYHQNPSFM